ncbi:MAG: sigma-70 family RNA polymerase sigma factor [bacterium]|nr:sigma-70 family RNA polymerase sigma factor [bacterium]
MRDRDTRDELLMLAAGRGDTEAFAELVKCHQQAAWRLACRFLGNAADAEDVVQDAFLKIYVAAPRYRAQASFSTYLHCVVSRLCLDFHRKKRPEITDALPDVADSSPSPSAALETEERDQAVRTALQSLPARQRLAVVLRYYENCRSSEIAQILGVSEKAVEQLLARARVKLKAELSDWLDP